MHEDNPPRGLNERTGKHRCITCLGDVPAEEYFRNDHVCDACLEAAPEPKKPEDKKTRR